MTDARPRTWFVTGAGRGIGRALTVAALDAGDRVAATVRRPEALDDLAERYGDALDVLVLGQEPVYPLTIVEARAIGVMRMRDEKGVDDKIVAVSVRDPSYSDYTDQSQLPAHMLRQVRRFFEDYKVLEQKQVLVQDLMGPAEAIAIIAEALELYRRLRRGDLDKGVRA